MKPTYKAVAVERRGGRTVFVVEHCMSGRRERIYQRRPGALWRFYATDRPVRDSAMSGAAHRLIDILRSEANTQLALYPTSDRQVVRTSRSAPGTHPPGAGAKASPLKESAAAPG